MNEEIKTVVQWNNTVETDTLDAMAKALEVVPDVRELASRENANVKRNSEGKQNNTWPNQQVAKFNGMARGLDALDTLGRDEYSPGDDNGNQSNPTTD